MLKESGHCDNFDNQLYADGWRCWQLLSQFYTPKINRLVAVHSYEGTLYHFRLFSMTLLLLFAIFFWFKLEAINNEASISSK